MRIITKQSIRLVLILPALCLTLSCEKETVVNGTDSSEYCKYDSENSSDISDPNFSESGIIPMNMNNYWRYTDSTWDDNGVLTASSVLVIEPIEVRKYGDEVWWRTNFFPIPSLHFQNDSIFDLQAGLDPCQNKNLSFFLFNQDSVSAATTVWGDIGIIMDANKVSSITTPAGTFTDCYYYHKFGHSGTTIKPGVGIVEWTSGFENNTLGGRKLTLIEYYLE